MKILYSTPIQALAPYPRADDEPVVGLDPSYLVLTKVETIPPSPTAIPSWIVDLNALEYRQEWTEIESTPSPLEPDWTQFNLSMIPPIGNSSFETWLSNFNEAYRTSLTNSSSKGNKEEVQYLYSLLKSILPPTLEEITEWQGLADTYNISLIF